MSFFMKLTSIGASKIAAAQAGDDQVSLTHIAVGDGDGNPVGLPTGTETALAGEVFRSSIETLYVSPSDSTIFIAEMTIASDTGGWSVREIGIFDEDGDLFAYGNFPETYKPISDEGSFREMIVAAAVRVSNTSLVNMVLDGSVVTASREWVIAYLAAEGYLQASANLQDLESKDMARKNLGVVSKTNVYFMGQI